MSEKGLPNYKNPPVIEVVFGVQFKPLSQLTTPHIGLFWDRLGKEKYPVIREMPELPHVIEEENIYTGPQAPTIEQFSAPPLPRIFFITKEQTHLVQLQKDKFINNWRKISSTTEYPRFNVLFPKFQQTEDIFLSFIHEIKAGDVIPDQYELTYVNHIKREKNWQNLCNIDKVFPDLLCCSREFLPEPEQVTWRKIYRMPGKQGRLHVSMHQAIEKESNKEIYVLNLTARGFDADIKKWFEIAHEWIVRGFADLTGREVQVAEWGKIS